MSEAHNCRFIASTIKMQRFLIHVCSAHTSRPSALYLISPLICTWLSVYLENRKKSRERRVSRAALTRDGNPAVSGRELAPAGHETADFKERELQRTPLVPLSLSLSLSPRQGFQTIISLSLSSFTLLYQRALHTSLGCSLPRAPLVHRCVTPRIFYWTTTTFSPFPPPAPAASSFVSLR